MPAGDTWGSKETHKLEKDLSRTKTCDVKVNIDFFSDEHFAVIIR